MEFNNLLAHNYKSFKQCCCDKYIIPEHSDKSDDHITKKRKTKMYFNAKFAFTKTKRAKRE